MLIPKKNRREVYKYLFKGEPARGGPHHLRMEPRSGR